MSNILPLKEQSINQVYLESQEPKTYMIPVYQRNYAWEEDEITTLIKDVYDSSLKSSQDPYFIGTLVTYKRGDNEYEVIDGQQRLTTIYIILKALSIGDLRNELRYGARKVSEATIKKLGKDSNLRDEVDQGISNGYKYATKALKEIVEDSKREAFKDYFLRQVRLIHYEVPKDVDLNHYFEVMNSRGEQLEKHEIVKSTLSQHLKGKVELATFCRIWEACSEMNVYIQQVFREEKVFGAHLQDFLIGSFEDVPPQDESEGKATIMELLLHSATRTEDVTEIEQIDKFQPIIDFPNFLLIVLKITRMRELDFEPTSFTLDDKELLVEFAKAMDHTSDKADFARRFVFNLLKAKFLLDNYIVHHSLGDKELSGDNPWKLQYYTRDNRKGYPKNVAEDNVQEELVHLLSMFEVTFTAKQRKNYLFYCLMFLFDSTDIVGAEYLTFLRSLADKYFYDVYLAPECLNTRNQPIPNAFDNTLMQEGMLRVALNGCDIDSYRRTFYDIYPIGKADIPLFVFNYTDYRLWRKYADNLRGNNYKKSQKERVDFFNELGCSDFELESFHNFYFSRTRKSLEHYYPQAKAGEGKPLSTEEINCFGNFAMIGSEANSSGSDWDPKTKLDHYTDGKADPVSVASLKFKIMMQVCYDNHKEMLAQEDSNRSTGMEWNFEDMKLHQEKILDIIIPIPTNSFLIS